MDNLFSQIAICSLELDNSREWITIPEKGLSNLREWIAIWENRLSYSRERIAIRENKLSNSRERITTGNPWERFTYPWEQIAQFDIMIYLWLFLKIPMALQGFHSKERLRVEREREIWHCLIVCLASFYYLSKKYAKICYFVSKNSSFAIKLKGLIQC